MLREPRDRAKILYLRGGGMFGIIITMKKYLILVVSILILGSFTGCGIQKPSSINNITNATSSDDLAMIKRALVQKTNQSADKITVTVLQNTGDHARGGVTFQDEQGQGVSGGYWFAVKEADGWRIVLDGNGEIPCAQMRSEDFPEAMIPDCCESCPAR